MIAELYFILVYFLFFFKQKTAYEMRISDWSSDVCSSDLRATAPRRTDSLPAAGPQPTGETHDLTRPHPEPGRRWRAPVQPRDDQHRGRLAVPAARLRRDRQPRLPGAHEIGSAT